MKKRKILSLLLATVTAGTLMSGCGSEKAATDGDVTVISLWTNNSHSKTVMEKLVNDWNNTTGKEKGIKIDYVVKGDDYSNQLEMAINAGNVPDIFLQGASQKYYEMGVTAALNEYP